MNGLKIFSGNSNKELAEKICRYLGISLSSGTVDRFSDGEIEIKLGENVRGEHVFIIQSTYPPAENLLELLLMIDAARRASAEKITAIIPYFGYSRQDKKDEPRVPISSKLIANLIVTAGADRVVTLDLHADQIQGFFDIPFDHLYATPILVEYFSTKKIEDLVITAPDVGRAKRAEGIARRLGNLPIAIIHKRRPEPDKAHIVSVVGDVLNKNALLVDDIISTGGTLINGAKALKKAGAKKIYAYCTHPVLAGEAIDRIEGSEIEELIVTDTIPLRRKSNKIKVISTAKLLAEVINRIHEEKSVSTLFI